MRNIILASASPRRKDILKTAGYDFDVKPVDVDESKIIERDPHKLVQELARIKAKACADLLDDNEIKDTLVIGADTLVFAGDRRLGKPADKKDWENTLKLLSGRSHSVITGVCLIYNDKCLVFDQETIVRVGELTDSDIRECIERGEDMDKAGGYAIQGAFSKYVDSIEGEYNNVVGFPIAKFRKVIKELSTD